MLAGDRRVGEHNAVATVAAEGHLAEHRELVAGIEAGACGHQDDEPCPGGHATGRGGPGGARPATNGDSRAHHEGHAEHEQEDDRDHREPQGEELVVAAHDWASSVTVVSPSVTESPGWRSAVAALRPAVMMPLRLPRSRMRKRSALRVISACCRETARLAMTRSLPGPRPMVNGVCVTRTREPSGGRSPASACRVRRRVAPAGS